MTRQRPECYYKLAIYDGRTIEQAETDASKMKAPLGVRKTYWPLAVVAWTVEDCVDDYLQDGDLYLVAVNEDGRRWRFVVTAGEGENHATIREIK